MTNAQRREHKRGNQERKTAILSSGYQHFLGGVCQDGKFTPSRNKRGWNQFTNLVCERCRHRPVQTIVKREGFWRQLCKLCSEENECELRCLGRRNDDDKGERTSAHSVLGSGGLQGISDVSNDETTSEILKTT